MNSVASMRRQCVLAAATVALVAGGLVGTSTASAATSYTVSLGSHGAARWAPRSSVYVNLKAMAGGTWKQQLWSGTCAAPKTRLAVLPSLVVPSAHVLSKTTAFTGSIGTAGGVVVRLLLGSTVICGAFLKPVTITPGSVVHGVNLVGMEMGWSDFSQATGPVADTNYPAFDERLIDYLAAKHVSVITFLFSWEGMQSQLNGPIPAAAAGNYRAYFDNYKRIVTYATGRGIRVIVAPWQALADGGIGGPTWRGQLVGSAAVPVGAFTDFWSKMATVFKDNP